MSLALREIEAHVRPVRRRHRQEPRSAPFIVSRFCSTSKLVGLFSLTIVSVPLPCVLNASMVDGLKVAPSEPPARGSFARIFPSFALRMTNVWGGFAFGLGAGGGVPRGGAGPTALHAANRTPFFTSSASPLHPPFSSNGYFVVTLRVLA